MAAAFTARLAASYVVRGESSISVGFQSPAAAQGAAFLFPFCSILKPNPKIGIWCRDEDEPDLSRRRFKNGSKVPHVPADR